MPALPYPMADLPAKPIVTGYEFDAYHRDSRSRNGSSMRWNGTGSTSASTSNTHPNPYDDRRSRYSSRSYNNSNSSLNSGSTIGSSGFHTSTGQPSPSSSTTSTGSSLRTPPDLLLNGTTLATNLTGTFSGQKGYTKTFEKTALVAATPQAIHLSVNQLERRLQLLSELSLSKAPLSSDLPTPPSSPKAKLKLVTEGKKRKADYSSDSGNEKSQSKHASRRRYSENAEDRQSRTSLVTSAPHSISESWRIPKESNVWNKELYFETAKLYRQKGRELKHRGDNRRRDISTNKRLSSSPEKESLVASLEQLDALLLYMYGFWCEDQACGGNCVVANWTSLYGLLKYVYDQLMKSKMTVLAGLCRLLEAVVRKHIANHEMRQVNHRLSKTVTPNAVPMTAQSPASTTAASPSSSDSTQQTLAEVSEAFTRIVADNERSARLMQQSRLSILNLSVLQEMFPLVSQVCEGCMKNRAWSSADQTMLAMRIDPSAGLQESAIANAENGWIWPFDINTPSPLIVCFGRAIVREASKEAKVPFIMESVRP